MDAQYINLAKDIINEVASSYNKLEKLDPASPYSKKNINLLLNQIIKWKKECDKLFQKNGKLPTQDYWGGEYFKYRDKSTKIGPSAFNEANPIEVDNLYKEGYHLATTIRKLLTGQRNRIRFLIDVDGELHEAEMDEEKLFSDELKDIIKITSTVNQGKVNAKYNLSITKKNIQNLFSQQGVKSISSSNTEMLQYILSRNEIRKLQENTSSRDAGRAYEAYYEALEKGFNITTKGKKSALTNFIQNRFKADTVWGVQQVGDIQEQVMNAFNQVQLKAFVGDNDTANWGGLPSLITQMNRIEELLNNINNKQENIGQQVLDTFYYDSKISNNMADSIFNKSKKAALEYINNNLNITI